MPDLGDRVARLYYDDSCGPCRLLARASEGVSHHRLRATPLDAPAATSDLARLSEEERYGSAHLLEGEALRTGADITTPLVALTLGPTAGRLLERIPPARRAVRWIYVRLWTHRRVHGCAAPSGG